jgi:plastocyanin
MIGTARPLEFRRPPVQAQRWIVGGVTVVCLTVASGSHAFAQELREVRLVADPKAESYRFEPASIKAKPGDVLLFRVVSGAPHNIALESGGMAEATRQAWNNALPGRTAELSGPLLVRTGMTYRVVVPAVPAGTYRYFCLTHRAYDERGEIVIH